MSKISWKKYCKNERMICSTTTFDVKQFFPSINTMNLPRRKHAFLCLIVGL